MTSCCWLFCCMIFPKIKDEKTVDTSFLKFWSIISAQIKKKYLKSKLYWKTVSMEALCTCAGVPACRRWESISDRERLNILSSPSRKLFLRLFQNSLFLWPLQWHCPLHVHIAHWNTTPQSITLQPKGKNYKNKNFIFSEMSSTSFHKPHI